MTKKRTILIVEDNQNIGLLLQYIFSKNYEVIYKENAEAALEFLKEGLLPDLIITDFFMPGMNGDEFIGKLKESFLYRDIPVIVVSANDDSRIRINLLQNGAEDFILKPFNPQELEIRVSNILKRR